MILGVFYNSYYIKSPSRQSYFSSIALIATVSFLWSRAEQKDLVESRSPVYASFTFPLQKDI